MLWAVAAAMAAVVAVAMVAPFLEAREGDAAEPVAAYDLRIYRGQLAEVERDLARGVITPEEAERLRVEIGRMVLEADRALARQKAEDARQPHKRVPAIIMAVSAVILAVGAFAVYQQLGQPTRPDEPLARRIAAAQQVYDSRPSQAEAEASALPPPPQAAVDDEYRALVDQLREAMRKNPDDPRGLLLLAQSEARLGRPAEAAKAMRRLIEVSGEDATAADHARLAALMTEAAGGLISREAETEIATALRRNPAEPQARYLQGLLLIQNQRPDLAFSVWRGLLESDPGAAWAMPIRAVIRDLAWLAGEPDYEPPAAEASGLAADPGGGEPLAGPDMAQVEAAESLSTAERMQMVQTMVSRLEARLAEEGGPPHDWARLITSLSIIGQREHAAEVLAEARQIFAGDRAALGALAAAADEAGLQ